MRTFALWNDPVLGVVLVEGEDCEVDEPGQEPPRQCGGTVDFVMVLNNGEVVGNPYFDLDGEPLDGSSIPIVSPDDLAPLDTNPETGTGSGWGQGPTTPTSDDLDDDNRR